MTESHIGRARRLAGTAIIGITSAVLIGSGASKLAHLAPIVAQLGGWGFTGPWITIVGLLEVTTAALFAIGPTRSFGILVVSSFLGGAVATHVQHHEVLPALAPATVLALVWLGAWLRHPIALWSLAGRAVSAIEATRAARLARQGNPGRTWDGRMVS